MSREIGEESPRIYVEAVCQTCLGFLIFSELYRAAVGEHWESITQHYKRLIEAHVCGEEVKT